MHGPTTAVKAAADPSRFASPPQAPRFDARTRARRPNSEADHPRAASPAASEARELSLQLREYFSGRARAAPIRVSPKSCLRARCRRASRTAEKSVANFRTRMRALRPALLRSEIAC